MKLLITILAALPLISYAKTESYSLDTSETKLNWVGRKITGEHTGTLAVKSGKLNVEKDALTGGSFEIDMTTLVNEDVKDKEQNAKLVGHLKSDDFFSVEKNPTAKFEITKVSAVKDGKVTITGDLTIKGKKESITFPAETKTEGKKITATATINVDRTKWNIKYRSGKFFPELGDKVIKDEFTVKVSLVAKK